jgi:hypothetical protein
VIYGEGEGCVVFDFGAICVADKMVWIFLYNRKYGLGIIPVIGGFC